MKKYTIKIFKKTYKLTLIQLLIIGFIIYSIFKFIYKKVLLLGNQEFYELPVKCSLSTLDKIQINNDANSIHDAFNGLGVNRSIIRKIMLDPFYNGVEDINICRTNYLHNCYGARKLTFFGIPFTDKLSLDFLLMKYNIFKQSVDVEF